MHPQSVDVEAAGVSNPPPRLRRSCHFVPGANERMFTKSLETEADCLILDLEDAVAPNRKAEARKTVTEWLRDGDFQNKEKTVRINPLDSLWGFADLEETMSYAPDCYVVPKPESVEDLDVLDRELARLEMAGGLDSRSVGLILIATETAKAALSVTELARHPRVRAMTWGAEDLSSALGGTGNIDATGAYFDLYEHCRHQTLLASSANGLDAVDSVFVDLEDTNRLMNECRMAATQGFAGKLTIHPSQIPVVNEAFTPDAEAIDEAIRLTEAFDEAQSLGQIAIRFEGKMVDVPHLQRAKSLLSRARLAGRF